MVSTRGRLRRQLFGIRLREATFARRGFPDAPARKRERLERIGREFLGGYHVAMEEDTASGVARRLGDVAPEVRGFAYEGASMALTLRSALSLRGASRFRVFVEGPADVHAYTAHVGAGWARSRLPGALRPSLASYDPLLRWLVIDGQGFHDGYFHPDRVIERQRVPAVLRGYERRAFDQGLGRCLWFWSGAGPAGVAAAVDGFAGSRRADLWSGIGIACAYAGGVDEAELAALVGFARDHRPHLAQGVAFGTKAHERAGHRAPCAELASRMVCGVSFDEASAACDAALPGLPFDGPVPAYEIWRARVRASFPSIATAASNGGHS